MRGIGIQIVDATDPTNLMLLANYAAPWIESLYMHLSDDLLYATTSTNTLTIMNISVPTNLRILSNFPIPQRSNFQLQGSTAYLSNGTLVRTLDVSNASNPQWVMDYNTSATIFNITGNIAYGYDSAGFQILNVTDSQNIARLGYFQIRNMRSKPAFEDSHIIYLSGLTNGYNLVKVDISDYANPQIIMSYCGYALHSLQGTLAYLTVPSTVVAGNEIHMLDVADTAKILYILNITDITKPTEITRYQLDNYALDMTVFNIIYISHKVPLV